MAKQGVTVEKRSQAFMMVISVFSPDDRYDQTYLANYTNLYLLDPIKRLPGANLSTMFPVPDIAMRIWLKPDRLAQLGITADDVSNAIQRQNKAYGVGQIGQAPTTKGTQQSFVVTTQGMLTHPKEFDNIILRTDKEGAAIVRLKDVGHAELGGKDYSIDSKVNGKRAVAIVVYQQPGANAIETSKEIRKLLKELTPRFPAGLEYKVVLDTSKFTEASIEKVVETFFEAVFLVVLVVFLFLQSFRATMIPILAVPIAIVGTYSGILMLGFSTNMLTLFGMILAIGLVVDDAIIVVENVEHIMASQGLTPMEAAKKAMGELAGALIAIVLVLCSVFVPVAFLGGMTGTLYKQFAITIAISMALSGVIALTLSPALAARILKPGHREKRGFFKWFENGFTRLTNGYTAGVRWLVGHRLIGVAPVRRGDRRDGLSVQGGAGELRPRGGPGLHLRGQHDAGCRQPGTDRGGQRPGHGRPENESGHRRYCPARRLQPARQPEQDQRRHDVHLPEALRRAGGERGDGLRRAGRCP